MTEKAPQGLRILLSAYACEPGKGSEPGVGWNWVSQTAARGNEVWVLTRANNEQSIVSESACEWFRNVHFVYLDLPAFVRRWKRGTVGLSIYYYFWQVAAYFVARRLHAKIGFDYAQHVTFVSYWRPSFISLLPIPFVWGPVGGAETTPPKLASVFAWRSRLYEMTRSAARWLGHADPFVRVTANRCIGALAMTPESAVAMKRLGCRCVQVLSEAAISQPDLDILSNFPVRQSGPFRILSLGRLIHWKGFELSIRAFARFVRKFPDSEYWIVGDGPQRKELARLISELRIDGRVRLLGSMPRAEAIERLRECHVLAHPSLHDSGGWVCLEAMAAARPVVCLDVGGPAVQVSKETGIKVRVETIDQVVEDLSAAFSQLASNPAARSLMGFAGRDHVRRYFTWSSKYDVVHRMVEQSVRKPGVAA